LTVTVNDDLLNPPAASSAFIPWRKIVAEEKTIRVRASSWAALFECAHRWEAINLLGYRNIVGIRAALGTAIHRSTAVFDQSRVKGQGLTPDDAAGVLVDSLRHPDDDVDYSRDDLSVSDAERIGLTLHTMYCTDISPQYAFTAVEMDTEPFDIECGDGIIIRLTGTMDRARIHVGEGGKVGITDLKSGAQAVLKGEANTKGHSAQVGTYEILYEFTTGEKVEADAEIIGLKTDGRPAIASGRIHNARRVMLGEDNQPGLIEYAARMFKTGDFYPNPKSLLCGQKYCPRWSTCIYRDR